MPLFPFSNLPSIMERHKSLYEGSTRMGGAALLRSFLGLEPEQSVPLTLAHGVDMELLKEPLDVRDIEPGYWATSTYTAQRAARIKPTILLPHPIALCDSLFPAPPKIGKTLIIGPASGKTNNARYLDELRRRGITGHILIKYNPRDTEAAAFWTREGFTPITAGPRDTGFYKRVWEIISGFEHCIGGTLSSALIFAASAGKTCALIDTYTYETYERSTFLDEIVLDGQIAPRVIALIENGPHEELQHFCRSLLYADHPPASQLRARYDDFIASLTQPFFFGEGHNASCARLRMALARRMNNRHFIRIWPGKLIKRLFFEPRMVLLRRNNEIDIFKNGRFEEGHAFKRIKYVKGKTEPGSALD